MNIVQQEADRLYRGHYGKMVASLLRFSADVDLDTAEDIVQDTFSAALTEWAAHGIPDNPAGWIYRVSRNKALNWLRAGKKITGLHRNEEYLPVDPVEETETFPDDQQLRLLFACAHPDLLPKVQVVITLKYVINFKVATIAAALGMTVDGIDKLLLRARQKIRDERILLVAPPPGAMPQRLPIVHKIIYLLFNEGYKSINGKELLQEALCEEALMLAKALLDAKAGDKDTLSLYALMLFNAARFKSRFDADGDLADLEQQDRTLWNRDLIKLGFFYMREAGTAHQSPYQYEAAIAYLHCMAPSFEATDWTMIATLYYQLLSLAPNPFADLNYAIALYYSGQVAEALHRLHALESSPYLNGYYLLNATLGKLYLLEGDAGRAMDYFKKTLSQTTIPAERKFIQKMVDKIMYL